MIRLIAAIDSKRGIAKTGETPWYIKADLQHFRKLTTGGTVLMGRKTYQTIGRLLPNRLNIVASRQAGLKIEGAQTISDVAGYLRRVTKDIWVIGGQEVFEAAMPFAQELYLTQIDAVFDCDKVFPSFSLDFELVKKGPPQTDNGRVFYFNIYRRKKS